MVDSGSDILSYFTNRIQSAKEQQLKELDLSVPGNTHKNDKLDHIPEAVFELTQLEKLDLSYNSLSTVPESITKLTNLTQLDLRNNSLSTVPESITKLTNLTQLGLSYNSLSTVPESITKLTNLTQLYLSYNSLSTVPESITKLTNLTHLYLGRNSLSEIPESIAKLTNLTHLRLSDNSLSKLSESIAKLTNLTQLDLSNNSLSKIPESINQLTDLTQLDLSNTNLKEIPKNITQLTNLVQLNLRYNSITEIPKNITQLTNLIVLKLNNNDTKTPPLEVIHQGIRSIRDYFRQLEAGQDYIYEAKLIIVGEGGAGKTTLAKKIDNPKYELQQDEATTEGIDVITWKFYLPEKERDFQVNIWDFGGQEIYHATHQFFLTKRSLYALVADTRKEDTDFYYWMNVVELLTDNSPVLIIKNEKQDRHREIDERRLRGEFTNLEEVLATNLKTNRDFDLILDKIQHYIKHLPLVGTPLPKTWVDVRKKLEELKEEGNNYISLDAYLTICEANGFDSYENSLQLSQYLHDLGVCLHFQDDPVLKNTVILEPEWGTDAVYKVLDDNTIIRNLGCFSKQDLANIWSDSKYQRMHNELLQLMIKFKLCYEISYQKSHYIAPQLLTLNQPDYDWNQKDNLLLRYSYEFMPKGILTRFIVEMHKSIYQNHVWRSGVILTDNYALGEVIEYYDKKEIRIKISGNNKRDLMSIIIREIDKINDSYERIKYNKLIPCNCPTCVTEKEAHFYRVQELKERMAYKQKYIGCGKPPFHQVQVLDLIDDVYIRRENQEFKSVPVIRPKPNKNTMKTIKIFLASSSELESDRKEFQIFIANKNKVYIKENIFLELVLWEDFIDAMSATRLQEKYNKAVQNCDIFVSLFHTKAGEFTEEEFLKALKTFQANDKPLIYTYFKDAPVNLSKINDNILSLINFKKKLKDLEHYPTNYADINDLKYKFSEQLIKVLPKLTDISQNDIDKIIKNENQGVTKIEQNFYGNVVSATGNVEGNQKVKTTNNQDKKINQSRSINISGNAQLDVSGAGAFNLGDISGTVTNTINQLPNFDNQPDKQKLKELLSQLQNAVSESELDLDDKEDTLEQIQAIAEALPDNHNKKIKRKAKGALGIIQDIAQVLPPSAAMVTICNQIPDLMSKIF